MENGHRMPAWVKVFVGLAVVVVAVAGALLLGGGEHGPGRHAPGDAACAACALEGLEQDVPCCGPDACRLGCADAACPTCSLDGPAAACTCAEAPA